MNTKFKVNLIRIITVTVMFALVFNFFPPIIQGAYVGWAIISAVIQSEDMYSQSKQSKGE